MRRSYTQILRERGIPSRQETRSDYAALLRLWKALPRYRREEFAAWAGVTLPPAVKPWEKAQ